MKFPPVLAESKAVGRLSPDQMSDVSRSMDLAREEIHALLDRAEEAFHTLHAHVNVR